MNLLNFSFLTASERVINESRVVNVKTIVPKELKPAERATDSPVRVGRRRRKRCRKGLGGGEGVARSAWMRGWLSVSARTLREPRGDLRLRSGHEFSPFTWFHRSNSVLIHRPSCRDTREHLVQLFGRTQNRTVTRSIVPTRTLPLESFGIVHSMRGMLGLLAAIIRVGFYRVFRVALDLRRNDEGIVCSRLAIDCLHVQ